MEEEKNQNKILSEANKRCNLIIENLKKQDEEINADIEKKNKKIKKEKEELEEKAWIKYKS